LFCGVSFVHWCVKIDDDWVTGALIGSNVGLDAFNFGPIFIGIGDANESRVFGVFKSVTHIALVN
jgi:hypothetical protein